MAAVGFASDPVNTEAPAFAHAFGKPDTTRGFIIGAFGAGAVPAAFVLAGRVTGSPRRMARRSRLLGCGLDRVLRSRRSSGRARHRSSIAGFG